MHSYSVLACELLCRYTVKLIVNCSGVALLGVSVEGELESIVVTAVV